MTTIPDAAIVAAAEADYYFGKDTRYGMVLWQGLDSGSRNLYRKKARAAIEAALPAIREHIAQEVADAVLDVDRVLAEKAERMVALMKFKHQIVGIVRGGDAA